MLYKEIRPIMSMILVSTIIALMFITLSAYTRVVRVVTDGMTNIIEVQDFSYEEYDFGLSDPNKTAINLNSN